MSQIVRWHHGRVVRYGLLALALTLLLWPALVSAENSPVTKVRFGASCQLVPIESVDFLGGRRGEWTLIIGGMRPYINMDVELRHRLGRRGSLTIEVVGCLNAIVGLPLQSPYAVDLPMTDFPRVRRVKIVGSNGYVRRRVPKR